MSRVSGKIISTKATVCKKGNDLMNRVCEILGITKPVIQAPMAWITSSDLVAAVSNAGGLGYPNDKAKANCRHYKRNPIEDFVTEL